ncbi:MAG TPA: hypothetical protein VHQ90_10885 [Thermoanaerobaculia bacterium]|nr:hypothetical protein [Thermoanaerobaculia bacterium]
MLAAALVATLGIMVACQGGRKAEKLDRDTALSLLHESGRVAIRGPLCQIDLVVYNTGPAESARLAFLTSLEPVLVKLTPTREEPAPGFTFMPSAKRPPVKRYEFDPADPKSAVHVLNGESMKMAGFAIADPEYKKVTGIVQEGSQAIATVEVAYAPNATYRTIAAALAKARPQPGFILPQLPAEADLAKTLSREVAFRRYDDGWRVEVPKLLF